MLQMSTFAENITTSFYSCNTGMTLEDSFA